MMNKNRIYFTSITLLASFTILASVTTFEVVVSVANEGENLTIKEQQPISFPTIQVDDSVRTGDTCYTSDDNHNQLCKASKADSGNRKAGVFSIISAVNTHYNIVLSDATTINGIQFSASLQPAIATATGSNIADYEGQSTISLYGMLELIDPDVVTSENTVFNYDITLTYN